MYRVVLACEGVPVEQGAGAAADIQNEFRRHRTWHHNVTCIWDGRLLVLTAENDYDPQGLALLDEFSDTISAYISGGFDGGIRVVSTARHEP